jgi:hypothetical protein
MEHALSDGMNEYWTTVDLNARAAGFDNGQKQSRRTSHRSYVAKALDVNGTFV